ncbi:MAG: dihydroorotate dehydrogenase [Caldisericia bacterium]|nr:dihydroorotate dehydrogenase [Caldisericia bacterium]
MDSINTKLESRLGSMVMSNPIVPASGTFGNGKKFQSFYDINVLGAVLSKSVTLESRTGNPQPRIFETPFGIMNSVGLENKGIDWFKKEILPFLTTLKTKKWVSISGFTTQEFVDLAESLNGFPIDAIEVNVSCPNIHAGGVQFCQNQNTLKETLHKVRKCSNSFLIAKIALETNPLDEAIRIISDEGFDAVCLGNTVRGLAIDVVNKKPFFKKTIAGLSGPAIKPIALRAVWEAYSFNPNLPIIGCGGIMTSSDVLEFIMAGASICEIGTANLIDPFAMPNIINSLSAYCSQNAISLRELVGIAH